jgi:murein L,D-transpeptidase YcbB/YkuD
MWESGLRIFGTSIVVLLLESGAPVVAETTSAASSTATAVAAAIPFVVPRPAIDSEPEPPSDQRDPDAEPVGESAAPGPHSDDASRTAIEASGESSTQTDWAAALRARLEARAEPDATAGLSAAMAKEREAIGAFYAGRDFVPLWFVDGKPVAAVEPAILRLRAAADDGLDLSGYPIVAPAATSAATIIDAEIALTDAVVGYARQASGSRVDPGKISRLIGARPEVADAAVVLALVATAGERSGDVLRDYNPPHAPYAALRDRLAELRRNRAPAARVTGIPRGPVLRIGMSDPRVPFVRARLQLDTDAGKAENTLYDRKVAAAVASFQKANGLESSGALTAQTIAVLSGMRPSRIEAEIIANMERWRWMPRDLGDRHIEVNIPDFEAVVVEHGAVVQRHRVVVGKEKTPTPIFSEAMRYLIVNPYWNIPPSIIRNEYGSDPGRLRRHGYQVFSRDGQLAARQAPGEKNALGLIKFMFPNAYSVYMHDTPSRDLFAEERRAFSHGCVRVDEPFRFAETLLGNSWTEARLRRLVGGKERYVNLPKSLPVHIEYFTAYVDESGMLRTREDIYGYSHRVRVALGLDS